MNKLSIIYSALVGISLIACSNEEDTFVAGPQAPEGNVGAFIANTYNKQIIYGDQPIGDTIYIDIVRNDTKNAISIPIIVDEADSAIHISQAIDFAIGQDSAKIIITSEYMEISKRYNVSFHIDDSFCNPYADVEGGSSAALSIVWADWKPVTSDKLYRECVANGLLQTYSPDSTLVLDTVLFYFNNQYVGTKIEHIPGLNRFRFIDFLNSGEAFDFSLANYNDEEPAQSNGKINVNTNMYDYGSYYAWGKTDWEAWVPVTMSKEIDAVYFYPQYGYDDINLYPSSLMSYKFRKKPGVKYICESTRQYDGIELTSVGGSWQYINFYFYYALKANEDI